MNDALRKEMAALLTERQDRLRKACSVKGTGERTDALILLCREALRSSSLRLVDGEPHCFDGRCYAPVSISEAGAVLMNALVDMGVPPTDVRRMGDMPLSVIGERSSASGRLLCFTNGILELGGAERSSWKFTPGFSPEAIATEKIPYAYNPSAMCTKWEAFLAEVLPDEGQRTVLQEFIGLVYADRSRLSVEKFAIFVGKGANGKSVIFEVLRRVLGKDNVSTLDTAQLTSERMVPYVKGKRLNFSPDVRKSAEFDSALKALASGQDVTGRRIYGDAELVSCPPLIFALNEMPRFRDTSDAFFRRILLFSFGVQIPPEKQDRRLVEKICEHDTPGIFNWVMEGCARLIRNGGEFSPCDRMDQDLFSLRLDADSESHPVRAYLERRGFTLSPRYPGQQYTLVSQNEIALALGGAVSRTMITIELRRAGVATHRSRELFYKVYEK